MIVGKKDDLFNAAASILDAMEDISNCIPVKPAVNFDPTDMALIGVVGQLEQIRIYIKRLYDSQIAKAAADDVAKNVVED